MDIPLYTCLLAFDFWTAILFYWFIINHCFLPELGLAIGFCPRILTERSSPIMEPADPVQEAICLQGIRLGQQAGEITALHQGMETIRANVHHLVERLTPQMAAPPTSPQPPGMAPRPSAEPRLPEWYEGDPGVRKKPRNLNQKRTQTRPKAVGTICPSDVAGREIWNIWSLCGKQRQVYHLIFRSLLVWLTQTLHRVNQILTYI